MPRLIFVSADGTETNADAKNGESVMQAARRNNIDGISAECGGEMMCATCHCYVDDDWIDRTGTASEDETEMLDFAVSEVTGTSRLSCQVKIDDSFDGLVVRLPDAQI